MIVRIPDLSLVCSVENWRSEFEIIIPKPVSDAQGGISKIPVLKHGLFDSFPAIFYSAIATNVGGLVVMK